MVAMALPTVGLARAADIGHRGDLAMRLRRRSAGVSRVALVVTAPFWLIVLFRGVLYPAFGGDDLEGSWGGPTLVGAWAVHLAIGVAALIAVSAVLAIGTGRAGRSEE